MYASVGKSTGSQPMLMAFFGWYTRIQSMRIVAGKVRCSRSTGTKFSDMPKLAMRYWGEQQVRQCTLSGKWMTPLPTIGSCETGLAEICTSGSAAMPAAFRVHAALASDIHVIYYSRRTIRNSPVLDLKSIDAQHCQTLMHKDHLNTSSESKANQSHSPGEYSKPYTEKQPPVSS